MNESVFWGWLGIIALMLVLMMTLGPPNDRPIPQPICGGRHLSAACQSH